MAGKYFNNQTGRKVHVTLFIRKSENPADNAGKQEFDLVPGQRTYAGYGDAVNIYLNGIAIASIGDGSIEGEQRFVIKRGSRLDDELNMNDTVTISYPDGEFQITTSNSGR